MKGWRRMEEGEVGMPWGRGSLWPDLLMKGWRRMEEGEVGMMSGVDFGGL